MKKIFKKSIPLLFALIGSLILSISLFPVHAKAETTSVSELSLSTDSKNILIKFTGY